MRARCGADRGDALLPHGGDIAMLLQTIVGAWPLDLEVSDLEGRRSFAEQLARWQEKALREAKLATDWSVPNQEYDPRRGGSRWPSSRTMPWPTC